jgi:chromosome segregation ATPase
MEELSKRREFLDEQKAKLAQQKAEFQAMSAHQQKLQVESNKTASHSRQAALQRDNEISAKKKELDELLEKQQQLMAEVDRYMVYKDFLDVLEEKSGDVTSVEEIMNRFQTLRNTYVASNNELNETRRNKEEMITQHNEKVKVCAFFYSFLYFIFVSLQEYQSLIIQLNTSLEQKHYYYKV